MLIPAGNVARAVDFYVKVFGGEIRMRSGQVVGLRLNGLDGGVVGFAVVRERVSSDRETVLLFNVDSIDDAVSRVVVNEGFVRKPTEMVPLVGLCAFCEDTEGNRFGLVQPSGPLQ